MQLRVPLIFEGMTMKPFTNTENKEYIRILDYGFIKEEFQHHQKKLRYFGLPSEGLYDIQTWDKFISEIVAVEIDRNVGYSKQSFLVSKAIQLGYHNRLSLLRGDINDIIINDKDEIGTRVPYPFELINLDYGGSILYPDRKRIDALEILFMRQRLTDFLLLITSNVREFDKEELISTQKRIHKEIVQYRSDLDNRIDEYFKNINEIESVLRQIIHLQFLVKNLAEQKKYNIECFPGILYEGSRGTKLIHYIFRSRYQETASTKVISDQSLLDLLCQKSQELKDGELIGIEPVLTLEVVKQQ